ncbi:cupin domain-containing protein [Clostridium sp. 'deep sea']|uniref:cupin domain-containing protein n=1 Tax=Clostridium sp. 'deep sea' TaxID=2779445 RepID=UPI00189667F7|nr:cupin domain-containing protein [Clostridium sp. 'deep sea']QOR33708.1 cupin domain-containing protein [Clostridium sp. 'deep sea']
MLKTQLIKRDYNTYQDNPAHVNVEIKTLVDKTISNNIKTALVKVLENGEIKPHSHETLEIFHILEGNGIVLINGDYQKFECGDTIYAPAGVIHGLKNTEKTPVILLANFPNYKS